MKRTVYRVQDKEGRGPWRPGFSWRWIDDNGPPLPPAIHEDFGAKIYTKLQGAKGYCGTACESLEALGNWFTPRERVSLCLHGYVPVCILADEIIAESKHQLVIRCDRPLYDGAIALPWSSLEATADA